MKLLRMVTVFALGVCSAILANELFQGAFCSFGSGCEAVTASAYGHVLGVPLPAIGLAGFGLVLVLSLSSRSRCVALLGPLVWLAGAMGLGLIAVQVFVLQRLCTLCLLVDGAAVVMAGTAFWRKLHVQAVRGCEEKGSDPLGTMKTAGVPVAARGSDPFFSQPLSWLSRAAWIGAGTFAVALPTILAWLSSIFPAPDRVMSYWVPGKVTIVEVTDFDCPNCLAAEWILQPFLQQQGDSVRFVRIVAPMPWFANSRPAARAYLAACAQGKGEAMAAALFTAQTRTAVYCRELARQIGLDLAEYDRTVAAPETKSELDANVAWAEAHAPGLPALWIQDRRITGVPSLAALRNAFERAVRHMKQ